MYSIPLSRQIRPLALAITILWSVGAASAQLVGDGATLIINGTTTNIASFLTIGSSGPNTTLIVTNGGGVTADNAGIGGTAGSSNNLVAVSGVGSRMTTPGGTSVFRIGQGAAFNRLTVSQGGAVTTGFGVVGFPVGASNNSVFITDSGSAWTNNVLYVGEGGRGNSLQVVGGARVVANASTIGVVAGANNNWATVTGANSLWSTANNVLVGDADGQSRLFVNNGGKVTSGANIILGNQSTSGGNLLSVTAGTATATNASGTGTLDVRRGNVEFNDGLIAADQLLLTNAQGSFTFNGGTLITRGATINNGQDFVVGANANTGPAGATFVDTTTMTIPGSGTFGPASPYPSVINVANLGGTITKVTVTLSNLSHTFPGDLDVLLVGPDGQKVMLMSDAGSGGDLVGVNLTFADAAAGLLTPSNLITNGTYRPTDYETGDAFPPTAPPGPYSTNLATFNGTSANGAWSLYIVDDTSIDSGSLGAWSLNIVTAPAVATSATLANDALITINDHAPATPYPSVINVTNLAGVVSRVTVTVSNFTHTSSYDVDLLLVNPEGAAVLLMRGTGEGLTGATLTFDDAATSTLPSSGSIVSGTYRPTVYVIASSLPAPAPAGPYSTDLAPFNGSNPNGVWSLFVNDRLNADIGAISNGWSLHLETITSATWDVRSNAAPTTVSGGLLLIGSNAPGATLLITNGAALSYSEGFIALGREVASTNNRVVISNPGSTLNNLGSGFYVGNRSSGNLLVISNGATAVNITGVIGDNNTSSNNRAIITGTNSLWNNNLGLDVGTSGSGNQLVVSDGAVAANNNAFIGRLSSANNNMATVTGAGSLWNNSANLTIGNSGSGNQLTVSNGAVVANVDGILGSDPSANSNAAVVTGTNSTWNNSGTLTVGNSGSGNQLIVSNGAVVANGNGNNLGVDSTTSNNLVLVTGPGSLLTNSSLLLVGYGGKGNQLVVSNGAVVVASHGTVGVFPGANNNMAIVTGPGSLWMNRGDFNLGVSGSGNQLLLNNGGTVSAVTNVLVGSADSSTNNRLTVAGGTLRATNSSGTGRLEIRRGTNVLNAGLIEVDKLLLTNAAGFFEFNGGTINARSATVANGALFTIGNGSSAASYNMIGTNTHAFASGLRVANNATLAGNGNVNSVLTVASGGTLSPGLSIGRIVLFFSPTLQGNVSMEIGKNGVTLAGDRVDVSVAMTYGGSLTVSNLGPDVLALGNSFQLFSAPGYSGSFSSISLPALGAGLSWTNRLWLNGTIAVVNKTAPQISGFTKSGTNLIYNVTGGSPGAPWYRLTSTNLALPLANWTTNGSGVFDWMGNVTVTNGINSAEPQRYFRIYAP